MSLLGNPKAFAKVYGPNNSESGPVLDVRYLVVKSDNGVEPGPIDTWFTAYVPFNYSDSTLTIELRVIAYLITQTGYPLLNVVLIP